MRRSISCPSDGMSVVPAPGAPAFQHRQFFAAGMVGMIARNDLGERVVTGKRRAENHAGVVAHGVGQSPAVGQLRAFAGGLVAHDQRDAGVAQRVDARRNRQSGNAIQGCQMFGGTPNSLSRSKAPPRPASLMTSRDIRDVLKSGLSPFSLLTRRRMCFSDHGIAELCRDGANELSPRKMRSILPSSKICSVPGRPSDAPVITTGALDEADFSPR